MLIVVDLYTDTCSPNLIATLKKYDVEFKIIKELKDLDNIHVSSIILTGSPMRLSTPIDFDKLNVATYCHLNYAVPILGICFGFQLLNALHGGSVKVFGRLVSEEHRGLHFNFNDVIDKVGKGFAVARRIKIDGRMVICHIIKSNIVGYLFHPESDFDKESYLLEWLTQYSTSTTCKRNRRVAHSPLKSHSRM